MMPTDLPVDKVLDDLKEALRKHNSVVLQAPTGSGKTTRVSPALLRSGMLGDGKLLLLQPRRVAARACARTMAAQMGEKLGETVGYHIRFERKSSKQTKILVVTEGILTRMFATDPMLEDISCVVLDEFHERSLHTDLALAFLKELRGLRDDLKVVVMSATLDADPVSRYFDDCPVITAEGRLFPLAIENLGTSPAMPLEERVELGLKSLLTAENDDGGHILVFLPGAGEINRTLRKLSGRDWGADIVPLHGGLSSAEQDAALTPGGRRRIILATNIAETSLTIEGVTAVVDTGLHKMLLHDASRGTDRLDRVRISLAAATQRAGRAGRTAPGRVVRLWSQEAEIMMPTSDAPEITRADLSSLLLSVLDFHGPDLDAFPFFEKPPEGALNRAFHTLESLGALDDAGRLSELGKRLGSLPLHPRLGAIMNRAAEMGLIDEAATLCALLEVRGPKGDADLFHHYELFTQDGGRQWEPRARRSVSGVEGQLRRQGHRLWSQSRSAKEPLSARAAGRLMLAGYSDRLCRSRGSGAGLMVGGRGVVYEGPQGKEVPYFLALELVERGKDRTAGKADRILPLIWDVLREDLPLTEEAGAVFDEARSAVNGVQRWTYADLVLREKPNNKVPPEALSEVLTHEAIARFDKVFQPDKDTQALLNRLRFAAKNLPEEEWPDFSEDGIKSMLRDACYGKRKFDELRRTDWRSLFLNSLPWPTRQLLDQEVPERIKVPSGSEVRIDYGAAFTDAGYPVLAVRLQELFGLSDTPTVAKGRVPLLCYLLAPNMRPAQMTRDLRNFWNNTYADVRRELRQRYPKHSWPEDPWTAQAIRGVPRRKK